MATEMYDMLYRPEEDERNKVPHDVELAQAAIDLGGVRDVGSKLLYAGIPFEQIPDILIQDYGFSSDLVQKSGFYPKGFADETDYFSREKNNVSKSMDFLLRQPAHQEVLTETQQTLYQYHMDELASFLPALESPLQQAFLETSKIMWEPHIEAYKEFMGEEHEQKWIKTKKIPDQDAGNAFLQENREDYVWNLLQNVGDPGSSVLNAIDMILNRTYDGE